MCRFIAYLGLPILISDVLMKTKNSLIRQSMHARESDVILNGDGFGLGWYNHDVDGHPGVFKSIQPAWSDENLASLASKIRSACFFAHVRAASTGSTSLNNCHPFAMNNYLFMHNGGLGEFTKLKRLLRRGLLDETYNWIKGDTDSEHFAALFWDTIKRKDLSISTTGLMQGMDETLKRLNQLKKELKITEPDYINCVITHGRNLFAMRYVSDPTLEPSSLHYASGDRYVVQEDGFMVEQPTEKMPSTVLIVSERLDNHRADWREIKPNHYLTVNASLEIEEHPIKIPSVHKKKSPPKQKK